MSAPRIPWPLTGLAALLLVVIGVALVRVGPDQSDSAVAQDAGVLPAEPIEARPDPRAASATAADPQSTDESGNLLEEPAADRDPADTPGASRAQDAEAQSGRVSRAFEKLLRPPLDPGTVPDSLHLSFRDGRAPRAIAVWKRRDGVYLDINDLVPITGEGYTWDPESYRGHIQIDSLGVNFTLDTPLFWAGSQVHQLSAPVRYADERLLVPYDILERIIVPTLGARAAWNAKDGTLRLTPPEPWLRTLEITRENDRLLITVGPSTETTHRLRWDPQGRLELQVRGLALPPDFGTPRFQVAGLERVDVRPTLEGFQVLATVDAGWIGARSRVFPEASTFRVELTTSIDAVEKGDFELLTAYFDATDRPRGTGPGRVLLEVSGPRGSSDGQRYLDQLADELRRVLEEEFRHDVEFVRDRKDEGRQRGRYGLPEMPPVPDGDCWIGLRLESYPSGGANHILLVHSGMPPHFEDLPAQVPTAGAPIVSPSGGQVLALPHSSSQARGQRMVPWGQIPRMYAPSSARLANTLAEHLEADLKFRPVRSVARPARVFRGVAMPAVLVYPAVEADEAGLRALSSRSQIEEVARSLAFGIDEFLSARRGGRR